MYTSKEEIFPGVIVYKNALPFHGKLEEKYERIFSESNKYKWQQARVGYNETEISNRKCVDFKYKLEHVLGEDSHSIELQETHNEITKSLQECLKDYSKKYRVDVAYQEAINVVKYGPGEYFKAHSDDGEPYRCTVSAVGYPNDNYEGGELYFLFFDKTYKPEAGDMVIFPSAYVYAHEAMPVHSGIKYSLVIMNDRSELGHQKDSPIYYPVENR